MNLHGCHLGQKRKGCCVKKGERHEAQEQQVLFDVQKAVRKLLEQLKVILREQQL